MIKNLNDKIQYYLNKLNKDIQESSFISDLYKIVLNNIKEFKDHLFIPISEYKEDIIFDKEEINNFVSSVIYDTKINYNSFSKVSQELNNIFNENQDFKTSIKNQISNIRYSLDVAKFKNNKTNKSIYIQETFNNYDMIDMALSGSDIGDILTSEGIITIKASSVKNVTSEIKSAVSVGNGSSGNEGVLRTYQKSNLIKDFVNNVEYLKYTSPNNIETAIFDENPMTIFEYQNKEPILVDIFCQLSSNNKINWIEIEPYIQDKSRNGFMIEQLNFKSNKDETEILIKEELSLLPKKGNNNQINIKSQGIINFPTIETTSLSLKFSQNKWYNELMGKTIYKSSGISVVESSLPEQIRNGPIGQYIENGKIIEKTIEIIPNSKRYAIGLKGINLYYKEFKESSTFISKEYSLDSNIAKVKLYTNEYIPKEFTNTLELEKQQWIEYYIQINNSSWYPIIPQDKILIKDINSPPQYYLINSLDNDEIRSVSNNGYIDTEDRASKIRLKIVLKRPTSMQALSPILDQYTIVCEE